MNARIDPVVSDLNRYMDEIDEDDRRNARIAARTNELLDEHYNPILMSSVMEALAELTEPQFEKISELIIAGDNSALGAYIKRAITEFCVYQAADVARYDIEREDKYMCERCMNRGCPSCED